ncbi:hypothetical protein GALMADRAFT_147249 [Galerina marginata CBS 339.88]|uniref:Uncharacterized protein n=1 Tax=Galerina marginata (strain CBS 339.88) TaxID=685588 RepID=A0A067SKE0_GALM3|nr:hypothetical protein GALMADRAFT_147249 [Galerina marginata CBS 339.88]
MPGSNYIEAGSLTVENTGIPTIDYLKPGSTTTDPIRSNSTEPLVAEGDYAFSVNSTNAFAISYAGGNVTITKGTALGTFSRPTEFANFNFELITLSRVSASSSSWSLRMKALAHADADNECERCPTTSGGSWSLSDEGSSVHELHMSSCCPPAGTSPPTKAAGDVETHPPAAGTPHMRVPGDHFQHNTSLT